MNKNKIFQQDVNINNTLEFFLFIKTLKEHKQLNQWVNLVAVDLKEQSIIFGQPLGFLILFEYSNLNILSDEIFSLSSVFLERINAFNYEILNNPKIKCNNSELMILSEKLEDNLLDIIIINKLFKCYLNLLITLADINQPYLGVFKKWQIKQL